MTNTHRGVVPQIAGHLGDELRDDYVGLWVVPWEIRHRLPEPLDDDTVKQLSAEILQVLLARGAQLGDLSPESGDFAPWPAATAVSRALREWSLLHRDPGPGEIAWLA